MSPADLTPEQIANALQALAERDQVGIYVDTHKGNRACFQVIESRIIAGTALEVEQRSGCSHDYAEALAACRAAEFTDGKERAS